MPNHIAHLHTVPLMHPNYHTLLQLQVQASEEEKDAKPLSCEQHLRNWWKSN